MILKIYMVKAFQKWFRKQCVDNDTLFKVVQEIQDGLVDADLGNFLYKKRISISGRGKRAGARILVAYKENDKIFFLHGFAKNEKGNVTNQEKRALYEYVNMYMGFNDYQLNESIKKGELLEIQNEK